MLSHEPCSPSLPHQSSQLCRTSPASASRIPRPGSAASVRGSSATSRGTSAGSLSSDGSVPPSRLRRPGVPEPRKPTLKDLEDGWHGCIEEPFKPTGKAASPQLLTLGFPTQLCAAMPCRESHPAVMRIFRVCCAQNLYVRTHWRC